MHKHLISIVSLALVAASLPLAAQADPYDWHRDRPRHWHEHDPNRGGWYHNPYWWNGRYIVAPVPPPVVVAQPYYYGAPPIYMQPQNSFSLSIGRR